eukprot:1702833-Amphidinium_carterae.1
MRASALFDADKFGTCARSCVCGWCFSSASQARTKPERLGTELDHMASCEQDGSQKVTSQV